MTMTTMMTMMVVMMLMMVMMIMVKHGDEYLCELLDMGSS